jgi:NAD-dependent dihydropyrimidine dehydrogenase PreA subunit
VADRVSHRQVILPQLAATGVLALDVFRRAHWRVRFGPVDAKDLPAYLATHEKTDSMRRVRFSLSDRLQMATAWAFPTSVVVGGLAALMRPQWLWPILALVWVLAVTVFTIYDRLGPYRRALLGIGSIALSLGATLLVGGGFAAGVAAILAPALVLAILTFDYTGSTPIEGGSHFEERKWTITLDTDRCEGVFRCWEVCPEACFERHADTRKVELAHDDRCIRCGACVVQCPKDALFFEDEAGERIQPDVIRRFKLNLLGRRGVDVG